MVNLELLYFFRANNKALDFKLGDFESSGWGRCYTGYFHFLFFCCGQAANVGKGTIKKQVSQTDRNFGLIDLLGEITRLINETA